MAEAGAVAGQATENAAAVEQKPQPPIEGGVASGEEEDYEF